MEQSEHKMYVRIIPRMFDLRSKSAGGQERLIEMEQSEHKMYVRLSAIGGNYPPCIDFA